MKSSGNPWKQLRNSLADGKAGTSEEQAAIAAGCQLLLELPGDDSRIRLRPEAVRLDLASRHR